MIKIWAKLYNGDKITKQYVFNKEGEMDWSEFYSHVHDICEALDIPTPVVLKAHIFNFAKFNTVRFKNSDFVESLEYDKFVLDNLEK